MVCMSLEEGGGGGGLVYSEFGEGGSCVFELPSIPTTF